MFTFLFESTTFKASTSVILDFDEALAPKRAITEIVNIEYKIAENNNDDISDFGMSSWCLASSESCTND